MTRLAKCRNPLSEPLLIKASRLAQMLCVSKTTLCRLRSSGRLPRPIRIGGSVRWRVADINSWIEQSDRSLPALPTALEAASDDLLNSRERGN